MGFIGLFQDEAYYWVLAQKLSWGYFDHPPMLPWLIKLGTTIFGDTIFGVRFVPITLSLAGLWLLSQMVHRHYKFQMALTVLSIPAIHLVWLVAVPDTALFFFVTLFYYSLYKYQKLPQPSNILLLVLAIVGMCLSKYHAVLPIVFTLLAYPQIFKKPSFYLIAGMTMLCLTPAIQWQIRNDYPTLHYQLFDRAPEGFEWQNLLSYVVMLPLLYFIGSFKLFTHHQFFQYKDQWDRILKWNVIGTVLFFLLMTFKGKVEAHWLIVICVPIALLLARYSRTSFINSTWFKGCIILLVGLRILLIDPIAEGLGLPLENVGRKKWAVEMGNFARDKQVFFMNSYQNASLYNFYNQAIRASTLPNYRGRLSQYQLWPIEQKTQGKPSIVFFNFEGQLTQQVNINNGIFHYYEQQQHHSLGFVHITTQQSFYTIKAGDTLRIAYSVDTLLPDYPFEVKLNIALFEGKELVWEYYDENFKWSQEWQTCVCVPKVKSSRYRMRIGLYDAQFPPYINCATLQLKVTSAD